MNANTKETYKIKRKPYKKRANAQKPAVKRLSHWGGMIALLLLVPSYMTDVTYWMRITWDTGIGFHDATWQGGFGGSLYQIPTVGSHGCINMPFDQAAALYDMIEIGTPVIIHY